uniref:Uncharacterized protein n=1 Tax=Oncorhynchus kisutch TaxID=8019 RepID=A0A8C7DUY6_ONCKI
MISWGSRGLSLGNTAVNPPWTENAIPKEVHLFHKKTYPPEGPEANTVFTCTGKHTTVPLLIQQWGRDGNGEVLPGSLETKDGEMLPGSLETKDGEMLPGSLETKDGEMLPGSLETEDGKVLPVSQETKDGEMLPGSLETKDGKVISKQN